MLSQTQNFSEFLHCANHVGWQAEHLRDRALQWQMGAPFWRTYQPYARNAKSETPRPDESLYPIQPRGLYEIAERLADHLSAIQYDFLQNVTDASIAYQESLGHSPLLDDKSLEDYTKALIKLEEELKRMGLRPDEPGEKSGALAQIAEQRKHTERLLAKRPHISLRDARALIATHEEMCEAICQESFDPQRGIILCQKNNRDSIVFGNVRNLIHHTSKGLVAFRKSFAHALAGDGHFALKAPPDSPDPFIVIKDARFHPSHDYTFIDVVFHHCGSLFFKEMEDYSPFYAIKCGGLYKNVQKNADGLSIIAQELEKQLSDIFPARVCNEVFHANALDATAALRQLSQNIADLAHYRQALEQRGSSLFFEYTAPKTHAEHVHKLAYEKRDTPESAIKVLDTLATLAGKSIPAPQVISPLDMVIALRPLMNAARAHLELRSFVGGTDMEEFQHVIPLDKILPRLEDMCQRITNNMAAVNNLDTTGSLTASEKVFIHQFMGIIGHYWQEKNDRLREYPSLKDENPSLSYEERHRKAALDSIMDVYPQTVKAIGPYVGYSHPSELAR